MRRRSILFICLTMTVLCRIANCAGSKDSSDVLTQARFAMVEHQIKARGIHDERVLHACEIVPRDQFVPADYRSLAYSDQPLPIGYDQTISQPYIVALMTELLDIDSTDKVLEIGTGSGYQAAILSVLASEVFTIEIVEPLTKKTSALLEKLGYHNVTVRCGDGFRGWEDEAPFDCIMVTCAPTEIPPPLIDQLADGGKLVIPVGEDLQELILLTKDGKNVKRDSIIPVRFVPMTGETNKK